MIFRVNGKLRINNNTVATLVPHPAGSVGIRARQEDFNGSPMSLVDGNVSEGWTHGIQTYWGGKNPGVRGVFVVRNNILNNFSTVESGAAPAQVFLENNRTHAGTAYQ